MLVESYIKIITVEKNEKSGETKRIKYAPRTTRFFELPSNGCVCDVELTQLLSDNCDLHSDDE